MSIGGRKHFNKEVFYRMVTQACKMQPCNVFLKIMPPGDTISSINNSNNDYFSAHVRRPQHVILVMLQENDWGCIPEVVSDRKGFRRKNVSLRQ